MKIYIYKHLFHSLATRLISLTLLQAVSSPKDGARFYILHLANLKYFLYSVL